MLSNLFNGIESSLGAKPHTACILIHRELWLRGVQSESLFSIDMGHLSWSLAWVREKVWPRGVQPTFSKSGGLSWSPGPRRGIQLCGATLMSSKWSLQLIRIAPPPVVFSFFFAVCFFYTNNAFLFSFWWQHLFRVQNISVSLGSGGRWQSTCHR